MKEASNCVVRSGRQSWLLLLLVITFVQCKKSSSNDPGPTPPPTNSSSFDIVSQSINGQSFTATQTLYGVSTNPSIRVAFTDKVDRSTTAAAISFYNKSQNSASVPFGITYQNSDSALLVSPSASLVGLNEFVLSISTALKSVSGKNLSSRVDLDFITAIDSSIKMPAISASALVYLVHNHTFKYFWAFA